MFRKEISYKELCDEVKDKNIHVFGGFSGLGYENEVELKKEIKEKLESLMQINHNNITVVSGEKLKILTKINHNNIVVVSGGTPEGIGCVYEVAKSLNIPTYGIVSDSALEYSNDPSSPFCDKIYYSKQEKNTWTVKENGVSLMVDVAKQGKSGCLHYYGGGEVSLEEITEAIVSGVNLEVFLHFAPNQEKVKKKLEKTPGLIVEQVKNFFDLGLLNLKKRLK